MLLSIDYFLLSLPQDDHRVKIPESLLPSDKLYILVDLWCLYIISGYEAFHRTYNFTPINGSLFQELSRVRYFKIMLHGQQSRTVVNITDKIAGRVTQIGTTAHFGAGFWIQRTQMYHRQ